ncbi:signal peptide-containing protein [Theileria equi strain WA]|uniref:Signal peptide-containing protein n=1 Tax=Theileria equi strain WA TaxID=1537102 RepID=L0B0K2_THEEQ|nr:signal peptide-containing protein [Theileria equi strain WA]AFZ80791.1 signal peptide-containing protein [Theileria equi strain WA]|eukprot:XP_004830457.1 signal peptide-containing protein [Theileria equi strain WA]
MRTLAALYIFSLCKLCNAGWPCCLQGDDSDDTESPSAAAQSPATCMSHPLDTLDISNPEQSIMNVVERDNGSSQQKHYFPKVGIHITSVFDGESPLWMAPVERQGEVLFVERFIRGKTEILGLNIVHGQEFAPRYFEKLDGEWKETSKRNYFKKLNDVRFCS